MNKIIIKHISLLLDDILDLAFTTTPEEINENSIKWDRLFLYREKLSKDYINYSVTIDIPTTASILGYRTVTFCNFDFTVNQKELIVNLFNKWSK